MTLAFPEQRESWTLPILTWERLPAQCGRVFPNPSSEGRELKARLGYLSSSLKYQNKRLLPWQGFISSRDKLIEPDSPNTDFTCAVHTVGFLVTGYIPQDKPLAKPVSSEKADKWLLKILNSHHGTQPFCLAIWQEKSNVQSAERLLMMG